MTQSVRSDALGGKALVLGGVCPRIEKSDSQTDNLRGLNFCVRDTSSGFGALSPSSVFGPFDFLSGRSMLADSLRGDADSGSLD